MANDEHVAILKKGVDAWNKWRNENTSVRPDLSGAKLSGRDLNCANLNKAKLNGAHLDGTSLGSADLIAADLGGADLSKARLIMANLSAADLSAADLSGANICGANLTVATMTGADLREAVLADTVFGHTTLSEVKGLDQCRHNGPSFIDFRTLDNSGPLPIAFLRGVGLSDRLIEYLPSLLNEAIQHYSCFISHSSKDQAFAERLHADLQNKGVRCWFAPDHMRTGDKIIDAIDEAIRLRDKVLLILSEGAVASHWVEDEVTTAPFAKSWRLCVEAEAVVMQTWLSNIRKHYERVALLMAAVLATLYVFYGSWRIGIVVASLVIAVSLFWLRKIARGVYGAIEVLIGFVAIWDASTKGRGGFSAGFSSDFQRYEWLVILLQTAAAIYLMIRGLDNLEQWRSDKRTRSDT